MLKETLSNLLGRLRPGRFSAPSPRNPPPAFYAALKRRDQLSAHDVRAIAVHEAGHALLYAALRPLPVYVTVTLYDRPGRDDVLGDVTKIIYPHQLEDLTFLRWQMLMLLAGQAAEQALLSEETVGPVQDLAQWTELAQDYLMLCRGEVFFAKPANEYQAMLNQRLLTRALTLQRLQVRAFLSINRSVLDDLANEIELHKRLSARELQSLFAGVQIPASFPTPALA